METVIRFSGGHARFVYDDELLEVASRLGTVEVTRASHVEPYKSSLVVRWKADMGVSGGPVLGPFKTRSEALDAERQWLRREKGL